MASRRLQNAATQDKARRAVSEFRKVQPTLTAFARVLTGNQKVRVIAATGVPRTDGKDIFIQPPIELGEQRQHDRSLCDRRDWETLQQQCPACAVREEVMATVYHEISHIAFESFTPPDAARLKEAMGYIRQVSTPKQAERIFRRITENAEIPKSYMALASTVSPYFKLLANSLEDVRINTRMHRARPGTKPMMDAQIMRVMDNGVTGHDGKVTRWTEMHLNHQASIGSYLLASGFEPEVGWLADEVILALKDEALRSKLILVPEAGDAHEAFTASWAVYMRLRELGFYQLKEEENDDEPEPEEQPEPPKPPTPPTPPQPKQDSEEQDDSDDDAASDGGSSSGGSSDMEPEDDSDDESDEEDESSEADERSEESPESEEDASDDSGSDSPEESGDDADSDESGDDETEGSEGDDTSSSEEGSESASESEDGEDEEAESSESGDADEVEGDADASEPTPEPADEESTEAGDTGDDFEDGEPSDVGGGSEDADSTDDGGDEPEDRGGSDDPSDDGEPGPSLLVPADEDAEDEDIDLGDLGLHQHVDDTSAQEDKAIEVAIVQEEYFEKPSSEILGVNEWYYDNRDDDCHGRRYHAWPRSYYQPGTLELPPESILGPALMRMRLIFAENKRTQRNRNQRSGRLETRALGKRAPFGDDRLFGKKVIPGKRDYIVLIFIDVSGSTAFGHGRGPANIELIKQAAGAQAELLARMGIKFELLAHTGAPRNESEMGGYASKNLWLDVYHIKDADEPWDDKVKQRLADIGPSYCNLDGHTLEYARRRIEKRSETEKVILYYSDGKMPLENFHEELEILQREIATCKQKKITLLGVGIRTDSPAQHGLDTVEVGDSSEVGRVVQHLERRLVS